ncbi:MAG: hypothetical protein COA78_28395 [Blastopirellula sp.]|nr:MAG: hypothetical protein COA78_28395 [Blastopirellula sp.]
MIDPDLMHLFYYTLVVIHSTMFAWSVKTVKFKVPSIGFGMYAASGVYIIINWLTYSIGTL